MWDKIVTCKELSKSMKIGVDWSVLGYSYKGQSAAQPWWND